MVCSIITVLWHIKEKTTNSRNNGVCSHLRQVKAGRGIASPNLLAAVLQFFINSRISLYLLFDPCVSLLLLRVESEIELPAEGGLIDVI